MKPHSQSSTNKAKKGVAQAAAAAAVTQGTPSTAHANAQAVTGKKSLMGNMASGRKHAQAPSGFAAFAGSSVMAHDAVMKGVPGSTLTRFWESTRGTLPADAILKAIGVSARTAHRIKSDPDKPLNARTTDGIYRLESVRAMAQEVLGSAEAADEWLSTEAIGLEFRKPIDLVSTSPGATAGKRLLQRMTYGTCSSPTTRSLLSHNAPNGVHRD